MQNDERDDRAQGWDPEPTDADNETAVDPPADLDPAPEAGTEADPEDEFETATWPQHDLGRQESEPVREAQAEAEPMVEPTRAEEPTGADEPAPAAESAPAAEPEPWAEPITPGADDHASEPAPPPSEVEAYPPPASAAEAPVPAHSVPATEPGESTRCQRCGTENRPGISFCRNCGQRLVAAGAPTTVERPAPPDGTQACPRCGTHNRAGVAFCQNCGANLRAAEPGYVPPAAEPAHPVAAEAERSGPAVLGPVVLLIGAIGLITAWLLPFAIGSDSLYQQAFGAGGFGIAVWSAINASSGVIAEQLYFALAAASPLLVLLLVALAVGGFLRAAPAVLQLIGLVVALAWSVALVVLFVVVEVFGGPGGDLLDILRNLSPGGIIFMLASLIVLIGALTRIGRS